jgi:hypothetical protein
MSIPHYGDFAAADTINIPFNTFDWTDPPSSVTVTTLVDSDIYVHKDGAATPLTNDGASIVIDINGVTGNHMITIDTNVSPNDYTVGSEYAVRIEGATVDAGNINAWVGTFSIERAGGALALLKGTGGLTDINTDVEAILTDTGTTLPGTLTTIEGKIDTVDTNVDAVLVDTGTTIPTVLGTAAGADLATDIAAIDTVVDNLNLGIIYGTAQTGTLSTTQCTSDLSGYADDELIGRVIIFTSGTADGVASDITDYASASGLLTFTAVATAPVNGDTFKIV